MAARVRIERRRLHWQPWPTNRSGEQKKIGVRERSKQERQDRITFAARKLFAEQGYDATTLRQVAECAGLGLGTLFNYISDKRDLIYLVFNQEVNLALDTSLAAPRSWQTFGEKILGMIEPNYRLFGSEPVLSRILLRRGSSTHAGPSSCRARRASAIASSAACRRLSRARRRRERSVRRKARS